MKMDFMREAEGHMLLSNPEGIPLTCPVRIMHGLADTVVPPAVASAVLDKLCTKDAKLMLIKVRAGSVLSCALIPFLPFKQAYMAMSAAKYFGPLMKCITGWRSSIITPTGSGRHDGLCGRGCAHHICRMKPGRNIIAVCMPCSFAV